MQVRFVTRTHYQVDEPALLRIIVRQCTSPIQSEYRERAAARLVAATAQSSHSLNVTAAGYAIDLARACGVITENLVWSDLGHLLNIVADGTFVSNELSLIERGVFFRILLAANGAALVFLAHELRRTPRFPAEDGWDELATRMAIWVYEQYLDLSTDIRLRSELRHLIAKRRKSPFTGKSGPHQTFFHLQSLTRLGMLRREEERATRQYALDDIGRERVARFADALTDVRTLEKTLDADAWEQVGRAVYGSEQEAFADDEIFLHLITAYRLVEETKTPLVALSTLIDAVKARALAETRIPPDTNTIRRVVMRAQSKYPRQIRLHVDRKGIPAFVKMSDTITDGVIPS